MACAAAEGSRRRASRACLSSHISGMFGWTRPKRTVRTVSSSRLRIRKVPRPQASAGIAARSLVASPRPIDTANVGAMQQIPVQGSHYVYSDMTGGQLKSVSPPAG